MRAAIRLRSGINAHREIKETLQHMRLNKINHCVLVPEGKAYDGMLQKVKDYVTWGELKPEVLTNMMIKRGRLTGDRKLDNKYVKEYTESDSMVKYAEDIISGKTKYGDLKDVQPVFRLHPPIKGHRSIKKSFKAGGDLGYRGEDINTLILKMLGPGEKAPSKKPEPRKPPAKKVAAKKAPVKKKAAKKETDAKKTPDKKAEAKAPVKKKAAKKKADAKKTPDKKAEAKAPVKKKAAKKDADAKKTPDKKAEAKAPAKKKAPKKEAKK